MNKFGVTTALLAAAVGIVAIAPKASADEWDKKTIVTISEPMEVPGVVLQPGTYVFKLVRSESDRHIVEIQNERENHTFATIMAIPNYRLQPTGQSVFAFWETPAGQPKALRAWFYPADNFGQEFLYPKRTTQVSQVAQQQVPEAPAPAPAPAPAVAENTPPPPPEPAPQAAAPAPEPEPAPVVVAEAQPPAVIPQTASNIPLLALFGFGSIALALTLGVLAKRIG